MALTEATHQQSGCLAEALSAVDCSVLEHIRSVLVRDVILKKLIEPEKHTIRLPNA